MGIHDGIAILGLALLLSAYGLNSFNIIHKRSYTYNLLNLLGGTILAWYSIRIGAIPFIILQTIWAVIALVGIMRALLRDLKRLR